jgi:predicted lactoylglutathione lyase
MELLSATGLNLHMPAPRKVFINLPVHDLQRSMAFFAGLGFTFNSRFTDHNAACMILSEDGYVMLLTEEMFRRFVKRPISDANTQTEVLIALSCESRAEVDELVHKAVAAGGAHAMVPQDHGFMYAWSFHDLDGHHWEVLWMDPAAV